ncbi:MAG TPA: endonuclease/exonuclease/phosphatase family protein, partial [Longimicrobiales bacterium]
DGGRDTAGFRIVTFNFLAGGSRKRGRHWSRVVEAFSPDIVLAQECRRPEDSPGEAFRAGPDDALLWSAAGAGRWGSAVFVRSGRLLPIAVPDFDGWVVGGELVVDAREADVGAREVDVGAREAGAADVARAGGGGAAGRPDASTRPVRVFSVHCPAGKRGYVRTLHEILDRMLPLAAGADVVLGGDFNVAAGYRGPDEPIRMSRGERELLDRITGELGLIPCWQTANPGQTLAQTLRWTGNRAAPYHCDGIFVPASWRDRLVECTVAEGPEWERLSDHNPVVATFAAPS